MARHLLCNLPPSLPPPPWPLSRPRPSTLRSPETNCSQKIWPLTRALSSAILPLALSIGLFCASPPDVISLELTTPQEELVCVEDENYADSPSTSQVATNEEIVGEAWQIVNDSFLDAGGRHRWSSDYWLKKKEDVLGSPIQARSRAHEIIRRMLASLGDPYTRFLTPAELSKMARYDMTGIGINLREIPDDKGEIKLKVLGLLLDGPAHSAGVRQGDELLSINGVDVKGKSAFEASSMLQGPSETLVNITIKHGNCGPVQSIMVPRQSIAKTPVFYRLEQVKNGSNSVGYVRLKEFNALARKDLVIAMRRLKDMGASYFILDLRDNLGGLVQAGIEIAKLFLDKGETVTYTVGRDPQSVKNIVADTSPLFSTPLIVLVNKNTASASEIVATALHDNCKAVLVGERTYGKGLIQSVFELNDGSGMVVTIGKYVTPNHTDINGNGVDPDFRNFPGKMPFGFIVTNMKSHVGVAVISDVGLAVLRWTSGKQPEKSRVFPQTSEQAAAACRPCPCCSDPTGVLSGTSGLLPRTDRGQPGTDRELFGLYRARYLRRVSPLQTGLDGRIPNNWVSHTQVL
ncbi:Carboxyl-terminal-processing peptidase 1-chloroplastic [Striga hermonthica]|uniref:C-terminal processing peptidase n=1 Tax=Striga hermonthica TaxID=68872 RepID=A0A9N7RC85_STRHE|nr:Carboxyl-terminal-processing peptidase 1-chloroplastic [Striga hermonthica]